MLKGSTVRIDSKMRKDRTVVDGGWWVCKSGLKEV